MNLLSELAKADFTWTITTDRAPPDPETGRRDHRVHMTMTHPQHGMASYTKTRFTGWDDDTLLRALLIGALREYPERPQVLTDWFYRKGNYPVKLVEGVTPDDFSVAIHTAMRKLMDGIGSAVLWNAIHLLPDEIVSAMWDRIRAFFEQNMPAGTHSNRRTLGIKLMQEMRDFFDELHSEDRQVRFNILAVRHAIEVSETDDWTHGWLGYVVDEVAEPESDERQVKL